MNLLSQDLSLALRKKKQDKLAKLHVYAANLSPESLEVLRGLAASSGSVELLMRFYQLQETSDTEDRIQFEQSRHQQEMEELIAQMADVFRVPADTLAATLNENAAFFQQAVLNLADLSESVRQVAEALSEAVKAVLGDGAQVEHTLNENNQLVTTVTDEHQQELMKVTTWDEPVSDAEAQPAASSRSENEDCEILPAPKPTATRRYSVNQPPVSRTRVHFDFSKQVQNAFEAYEAQRAQLITTFLQQWQGREGGRDMAISGLRTIGRGLEEARNTMVRNVFYAFNLLATKRPGVDRESLANTF